MHKKSRKMRLQTSLANLVGGDPRTDVRGSWPRVSVRSPKLSFTNKKKHTTTTTTKDERRKMKNSHSRRRAERGGGSAAPPGTSVLNSGIRSVQSLCPKSLSKVSAQSLCPKSLSTPSKSSPGRALSASAAHLGAGLGLLERILVEKVAFQNVFQQISKK